MNTLILHATSGDLRGQEFALSGSANCVMGRSRSCGLRLPGDPTVSRQHCIIELDPRGAYVQDLGSLNGTHVNGARIGHREAGTGDATMVAPPRWELRDGDELRVCNNVFRVEMSDERRAKPCMSDSGTMAV